MNDTEHFKSCSAALCKDMSEQEQKEAIWYPGEEICIGQPHTLFQKEQRRINRWHSRGAKKYQNENLTFTADELTKMKKARQHNTPQNSNLVPPPMAFRKTNPLK